ncbi:MAG: phosphomannomutase/phosphoglucomutase [Candidatus Kaiserbacteria bacterium]|nr:phosphomannomutase/phosphoglucomutase [Candidatus Kaiserbacteria bacterium]MCB9816776.1 phosphomannomutase/phosphoglucomutase [Candidatus Nomurabacteria bacterium]
MTMTLQADYKRAFKDADIRAIYPTEIDDELVYFVARAFVEEFKYKKVLVARDMRLSTPALHAAFVKGATDSGADVIDLGQVHTPALYFASGTMNLPGVMITASHSPKQYNGLKLVHAQAIPLTEKYGLGAIRRRIERGKFIDAAKRGKVTSKNVLKAYQKFVLKGYQAKKLDGIKIAADAGNGMASVLLPLLQEKLPAKFDVMFGKLDGSFPNRGSDPTLYDHQKPLRDRLQKKKYDFGVAFDGDSDRIAFLDENGRYINSAVIGGLIAEQFLKRQPKAKIGITGLTSRSFEEAVKQAGGKPVLMRVGHAFIKESMRKRDVLFAAEHSGHFYFKDYFYTDSVTLTLLAVLDAYAEAKKGGKTFSEMMAPHLEYEQTEDTIVMVKSKEVALAKTEQYLKSLKPKSLKKFDGYLVDFGEVWGMVKPSVTEFAIKMMFESKKKKDALRVQKEMVQFVKSVAKDVS